MSGWSKEAEELLLGADKRLNKKLGPIPMSEGLTRDVNARRAGIGTEVDRNSRLADGFPHMQPVSEREAFEIAVAKTKNDRLRRARLKMLGIDL